MDGEHILAIRATGSGKTMLVIIPLLARPDTSALIIAPLNALECDLQRRFESFGISSIVINRETLREAAKEGRNLWAEARTARALFMGPEQIPTDDFEDLISHPVFCSRIALDVTEEVHVVDLWSDEFREAYKLIKTLRARLPPWVAFLGLTGTCRPGHQEISIVNGMGFAPNEITVLRGDCERHDLHVVVRPILYGVSGTTFGDLDWLIPESATIESLLASKTLVYRNSIKLGHRVVRYLRTLLPAQLRGRQHGLIRHMHSLCCNECKHDALDALCDVDGAERCTIEVATDVIGFGVDARRVQRVICFDVPDELNTLVHRLGRAGRDELQENATAFIYLKKSTMLQASTTRLICDRLPDEDVAELEYCHNAIIDPSVLESQRDKNATPHDKAITGYVLSLQRASSQPKTELNLSAKNRAMLAIVQASQLVYCIVLRLNQLYGNPGTTACNRCSVCTEDALPAPRSALEPASDHDEDSGNDVAAPAALAGRRKRRACMRKDLVQLAIVDIETWAHSEWLALEQHASFLDYTTFLGDDNTKELASHLLRQTSKTTLSSTVSGWKWWSSHGDKLWTLVTELRTKYTSIIKEDRRKASQSENSTSKPRGKRAAPQSSDSDDSDKENESPKSKRARFRVSRSPSPAYLPKATTTRFGREVNRNTTRPYDDYL